MTRVVFSISTGLVILLAAITSFFIVPRVLAAETDDHAFSLQVSPSPLVATVQPGQTETIELKIRNASTADEQLKIEARSFQFDNANDSVLLDDSLSPAISSWLTLPQPGFTVKAGQWQTQHISIHVPDNAGFSYSFALIISRNNDTTIVSNGRLLKGSVAVFTLINVNRPGATRQLELVSIEADKQVYEFLPATITIKLKNTGNSIVQPYGNLFIQKPGDDTHPLATMPVNKNQAYILPDTERSLESTWSEGFPVYEKSTDASNNVTTTLKWDFEQLHTFRFGRYTAKVVAVYNDGTRDVPIIGEVTFWVVPWKTLLLVLTGLAAIIVLFNYYIKRRTKKAVQKALKEQEIKQQP